MALPAGRKGVLPSELTPEGKIKGSSYTLPKASAETLGGVKIGSGLSINGEGVLSATDYVLPAASADTLGGVKVGSGLSIDEGETQPLILILLRYRNHKSQVGTRQALQSFLVTLSDQLCKFYFFFCRDHLLFTYLL